MLQLKEIKKSYKIGNNEQQVLKGIDINFRDTEFVSILGASGSGKTTLLNIIGGLDSYDSGDLIIDFESTKNYFQNHWDSYRNHRIGFVFQNYNLIAHQTILSNVELSLTLSGISKKERKRRATEALETVGLKEHINKLPNQLSGGQMQRVAIARALVNDPDIILADEPTGALDSETSIQIMNLLKEVSLKKLVIMVTHNPELADEYSTRIIKLKDGIIENDSMPYEIEDKKNKRRKFKSSSMSLKTSLGLSFKNLLNKRGRTILTAIAGSIGIIGIALILSLSNGVKKSFSDMEVNSAEDYPITIEKTKVDTFGSILKEVEAKPKAEGKNLVSYDDMLFKIQDLDNNSIVKRNNLVEFKKFLDSDEMVKKYTTDIKYSYNIDFNLYSNIDNNYSKVNAIKISEDKTSIEEDTSATKNLYSELPDNDSLLKQNYSVVSGKMPTEYNEIALVVNEDGNIADSVLYALNIKDRSLLLNYISKVSNDEKVEIENTNIKYDDIINRSYKLVLKNDMFKVENGVVKDYTNDDNYINQLISSSLEIKIVGILKSKNSTNSVIAYRKTLTDYLLDKIENSNVTKLQMDNINKDVFTNQEFIGDATYQNNLNRLGIVISSDPSKIDMYVGDKQAKTKLINIIKKYNESQEKNNHSDYVIAYTDTMKDLFGTVNTIVNVVSYILIAVVAISLIVSSIMIGIITYISVLERTKEIGILRAIGASRQDVARVFRAETIIEGFASGLIGIIVTLLLNCAINLAVSVFAKMKTIAILSIPNMLFLLILSIILTLIAGLLPSGMASRKKPVEALRNE